MPSILAQLAAVRAAWDVAVHPLCVRWARGEVRPRELARLAGQYRYTAVALAEAAERAGVCDATARDYVAFWDELTDAVGADADADPLRETEACAAVLAAVTRREDIAGLTALYALDAAHTTMVHIVSRAV